MTRAPSAVETAAIQTAHAYAAANGYGVADRRAAGLVLAGMAIAAACSHKARQAIAREYRAQHADAEATLDAWVDYLNSAAADATNDATPGVGAAPDRA